MALTSTSSRAIRRYHTTAVNGPRLVCFPHAGGSASFYFPFSQALAPHFDVLVTQYPGRQDRRAEPFIDSIPELAGHLAAALHEHAGEPLVLFGHSMGASVAFEVARNLAGAGLPPPARLFASARRAPSHGGTDHVHQRDDEGLISELRRMSGTDSRVLGNDELMRLALPIIRNDYRAVETYRAEPGARVDCPVTVLVGDSDPTTTLAEAAAWRQHTTAGFDIQVFPGGGHFYVTDRLQEVADAIIGRIPVGESPGPRPNGRVSAGVAA
jgi:pyochelin biosynthesis protein PchC